MVDTKIMTRYCLHLEMWRLESFLPYPPTSNTLHLHQDHGCSSQSVTCVQQSTVQKADVVDVRTRHRVVTEFLTAEGCSPTEIHRLFRSVYGKSATDVSTVRHWVRRFDSGEKHTGDMPRRARPAMAATSGIVNGSCQWNSWSKVPQFRATCADIKEINRRNSKGSAKQEDESGLPPA